MNADPHQLLRLRILDAFGEQAAARGVRAVVVSELVRSLGISSKTLYRLFASKRDLVMALAEWEANGFRERHDKRVASDMGTVARILETADTWIEFSSRFQPAFWAELTRDHPEAYERFRQLVRDLRSDVGASMLDDLRDEMHPELALRWLLHSVGWAIDRDRCDGLGLSRRRAAREVVEGWARACLRPEALVAEGRAPLPVAEPPSEEGTP